MRIQPF